MTFMLYWNVFKVNHKHTRTMLIEIAMTTFSVNFEPNNTLHNIKDAVARRCSVKKVFLEISQNSQCQSLFFNKA